MVLVEPAAVGADTSPNVEPSIPQESAPVHETVPSVNDSARHSDFDDAASLFDEPSEPSAPASPDLTETVEDIPVQAESRRATRVGNVEAQDVRGWQGDPVEPDEPDDVASPELSPPPRPVSTEALLPNADWTSASTAQWRNRVLTGMAAVVGVILALLLLIVFSGGDGSPTIASVPTTPETESLGDGMPDEPESYEAEDRTEEAIADSDPAAPPPEDTSDDASSDVMPRDGVSDDSSKPPMESPTESPPPLATSSDPAPSGFEPVANDPRTDEPPGLTPKEAMTDPAAASDGPSPLSDTLREFGALLAKTEVPASPVPAVPAELPPAPESGESEDEPVVRRTGPRVVELDDRLNDPVAQIEFDGVPLANFLRFVSDYSTIPITLDADILRWGRVSPMTVKLKAADTTVAGILNQGLAPLGLEHRIEADQLFVTRRPKDETGLRTVTFKVEDLVGDDAKQLQQLGTQIMDFVEPESWSSRRGIGTITFRGSELIIEQYETVQFEILGFCEKLRVARGLKTRSPYDASMFRLEARAERARAKLAQSLTLTYIRPAPLDRIVDRIAQASKLDILIDWRALAEAGWSPDAEVRFSVADQPVGKALSTLLEPMDLAYRIVDDATLQVITPAVLDSRLEIEFYRVPKLDEDGVKLLQSARHALGPANFRDSGGSGQLAFDEPSKCLLACLSQTRQMELQAWLATRPDSALSPASLEKTTPTATVESRIVPASGRVSND